MDMNTNSLKRPVALSCSSEEYITSCTPKRLKLDATTIGPVMTNNGSSGVLSSNEETPNPSSCILLHDSQHGEEDEDEVSQQEKSVHKLSNSSDDHTGVTLTTVATSASNADEEEKLLSSSQQEPKLKRNKLLPVPEDEYEKMVVFLTGRSPKKRSRYAKAIKFPSKLFYIVESGEYNDIVSWTRNGTAFTVFDLPAFTKRVLSIFFGGSKFTSFHRKLNRWSFVKVSGTKDTYSQPYFRVGQLALCQKITCTGVRGSLEEDSQSSFMHMHQYLSGAVGPGGMMTSNDNNFTRHDGVTYNTDDTANSFLPPNAGFGASDQPSFVFMGREGDPIQSGPNVSSALMGGYGNSSSHGRQQEPFGYQEAARYLSSNAGSRTLMQRHGSDDLAAGTMVSLSNARQAEELQHEARCRRIEEMEDNYVAQRLNMAMQERMAMTQASRYHPSGSFQMHGAGGSDKNTLTSDHHTSPEGFMPESSMNGNSPILMNGNDMLPSMYAEQRRREMMHQQMAIQMQMQQERHSSVSTGRMMNQMDQQIHGNSFNHAPRPGQFQTSKSQMRNMKSTLMQDPNLSPSVPRHRAV